MNSCGKKARSTRREGNNSIDLWAKWKPAKKPTGHVTHYGHEHHDI